MGRISWTRVIVSGLVAGLVINVSGVVLKGVVLEEPLAIVLEELGRSGEMTSGDLVSWSLYGFALGITSLWMYAAMRPRFGEGVRTVLYAGTAVWFFTYFTQAAGLVTGELFLSGHPEFMLISTLGVAWGWAELCVATALGAWLYQRGQETPDVEAGVTKIRWPRMMLAGLVVGIVFPLLDALFNFLSVFLLGVGYGDEEIGFLSLEAIDKLSMSELPADIGVFVVFVMSFLIVLGIVMGIAMVWIYEAIRPRFGSGVKTAVYAGVAAWFLFYCLGSPLLGLGGVSASIWGLFPIEGMILLDLTHLPALCLAVPLGVWIFLRSEFQNHVEANSGGS